MIVVRRVQGASMMPAYSPGRIVFGLAFGRPKVGDVVIARHHRTEIIKRVDQVKADHVYLLGDNPEQSTDSRQFGWLPLTAVMAIVVGGARRPI